MKSIYNTILALLLVGQFAYGAASYLGKADGQSVVVKVDTDQQAYHSGDKVKFSGTVKVSGKKSFLEELLDWIFGNKDKGLFEDFQKNGVQVVGSFPTGAIDITSKIQFQSLGRDEFKFSYESDEVSADDLNQFSLKVFNNSIDLVKLKHLSLVQGKLERRLVALNNLKAYYRNHRALSNVIEVVEREITLISSLIEKIKARLDSDDNLIAMNAKSIQVDNAVAAPGKVTTSINGFRLSLESNKGVSFKGESIQVTASAARVDRDLNDEYFKFPDKYDYLIELYQAGTLVGSKVFNSKEAAALVQFDISKIGQHSGDSNFELELHRYSGGKKKSKIGTLAYSVLVLSDSTAPNWLAESIPGPESYSKQFPQIDLKVVDTFGRIDSSKIAVVLNGQTTEGQAVQIDLTSSLEVSGSAIGDMYSVSGSSFSMPEGGYLLNAKAYDLSGNLGEYTSRVVVDRTPALISFGHEDGDVSSTESFQLVVYMTDASPVSSKVYLNGQEVAYSSLASFQLPLNLNRGQNTIKVEATDAAGNVSDKTTTVIFDITPPELAFNVPLEGQMFYTKELPRLMTVSVQANEDLSMASVNGIEVLLNNDKRSFSYELKSESAGSKTIRVVAQDLARNEAAIERTVQLFHDSTPPIVTITYDGPPITNQGSVPVSISVQDSSPVWSKVIVNGGEIFETRAKNFSVPFELGLEGENIFVVESLDEAGNSSLSTQIKVSRDTTPPQLTFINPKDGEYVDGMRFELNVQSNEPLNTNLYINSSLVTIPENSSQILKFYTLDKEGEVEVTVKAQDLYGNEATETIRVTSLLKALVPSLVGLYLDEEQGKMIVKGAVGVTRPRLQIKVAGDFFNSRTLNATEKGSFEIELEPAESYDVSVYDPVLDEDFTMEIRYGVEQPYLMAGVVKDIFDNPIVNAKVSVQGSNMITFTDGSGVFEFKRSEFPSVVLVGDQVLNIDGSTVIQSDMGVQKKYSRVSIPISMGIKQNNVLQTPIYMTPVFLDETSSVVSKSSGGVVTDVHAPDVALSIPSDSIQFPSGQAQDRISLVEIPADRVSIPVPGTAVPETVISLEPSGTKFSKPATIELPNSSSFAAGTDMLLVLYNSATGRWEIGGAAQVSDDGQKVVSKPGQGLSHFSLVYATPLGPEIRRVGAQDKPGANALEGAVTSQVKMPSFKVFGSDVNLGLTYKSTWAKPSLEVTNIFNFPDRKIEIDYLTNSGTGTQSGSKHIKQCQWVLGLWEECIEGDYNYYTKFFYEISYRDLVLNVKPTKIETQLTTKDLVTDPYVFEDDEATPENEIKPLAAVSFMAPLKDSQGKFFKSGLYPYYVDYKISFDGIVLSGNKSGRTFQETHGEFKGDRTVSYNTKIIDESAVNEVISLGTQSQILANHYIVQNKINSPSGRGWKVNGTQKLINPESNKVVIEESNGDVSTYTVANTVETILSGDDYSVSLSEGLSLDQYPKILAKSSNEDRLYTVDLSSGTPSKAQFGAFSAMNGNLHGHDFYAFTNTRSISVKISYWYGSSCEWRTRNVTDYYCSQHNQAYSFATLPKQMVFNGYEAVGIDKYRHNIFATSGSTVESNLFGFTAAAPNYSNNYSSASVTHTTEMYNFCNSQPGITCGTLAGRSYVSQSYYGCGHAPIFYYCSLDNYSNLNPGNNLVPRKGTVVNGVLSLNSPEAIVASINNNEFLVADTGNYLVRAFDRSNGSIRTIAGKTNQNNPADSGDGGLATDASLTRPLSLIQDSGGNIYIGTEGGSVRRVDNSGIITSIAGFGDRELALSGYAGNMSLLRPSGLLLDESQSILYIADTGHNRILSLNLVSGQYTTVAGTGESSSQDKSTLALEAPIHAPTLMKFDSSGNLIVLESGANKLKRVVLNFSQEGGLTFLPVAKDNSKLIRESDGSWVRIQRSGERSYFDEDGYHLKDENLVGHTVLYEYENWSDPSGEESKRIERIVLPNSQIVNFNYSGNLLASIVDPAGRETRLSYSANGNLERVTFPDGTDKEFEYDSAGLMVKEINQNSAETQYVYNSRERLSKVIDANQNEVVIADADSKIVDDNEAGKMPSTFDSANSITDANGNTTNIEKDFMGYIYSITDAQGRVTQLRRDEEGRVVEVIGPDGSHTKNSYDQLTGDLLVTESVDLGIREEKTYNELGHVLTQKNGNGFVFTKQYNSLGQLVAEIAPDGTSVSYSYNSQGLLAEKSTIAGGQTLSMNIEYNSYGQAIRTTDASGKIVENTYDLAGNIVRTKSGSSEIFYEFDKFNRLVKVTSPKLEVTQYQYSQSGQLIKIIDPRNQQTVFEYNKLGQLLKKTDSLGKERLFAYDANGNTVQEVDPNGNIKVFSYDSLNQLIQAQLPDDLIRYQYNQKGEISSQMNNTSQVSFQRDSRGRVKQVVFSGLGELSGFGSYTLNQEFDLNGNRKSLQTEYGQLNYTYDSLNRLVGIVGFDGEQFGFSYDSASRLSRIVRPGSFSDFSYNSNGTVRKISHSAGGEVKSFHEYAYDERNFPVQKRSIAGEYIYSYDLNGQLTSSTSVSQSESFVYDPLGNRITDQHGSYVYDARSQLLKEDFKYFYSYDSNGNLTSKLPKDPSGNAWKYSYSSANQLLKVQVLEQSLGQVIRQVDYRYDVLGRRIQKSVWTKDSEYDPKKTYVRKFLYDGDNIFAEFDGNSNLIARYTHSPLRADDILEVDVTSAGISAGIVQNSGKYFYLKDALGSVTEVVGSDGAIVQKYDYESFGKIRSIADKTGNDISSSPFVNTSFAFTGREWDEESDLYYYRARYYDPNLGRFLQRDPHPGRISDPMTVHNGYSYVKNRPTLFTDSTGMDFWQDFVKVAVIAVAIVAAVYIAAAAVVYLGLSGAAGAVVGSAVGASIGGIVAGLGWTAFGLGRFDEGFKIGAVAGAIAGGIAGYGGLNLGTDFKFLGKYNNAIDLKTAKEWFEPLRSTGVTLNYDLIPTLQFVENIAVGVGAGAYMGYNAYAIDQGWSVNIEIPNQTVFKW